MDHAGHKVRDYGRRAESDGHGRIIQRHGRGLEDVREAIAIHDSGSRNGTAGGIPDYLYRHYAIPSTGFPRRFAGPIFGNSVKMIEMIMMAY
jgi:hypothetical protein